MLHIVNRPPLQFRTCVHKRTLQQYAVLPDNANVETIRGTVPGRESEILVQSADGKSYYVLTPAEFEAAFDVPECE